MISAVTEAATAAPLAALLPARQGKAWKVGTAPLYGPRNHAATSRITDGRRSLLVVEEGNRVELYGERPDLFPYTPDVVVDSTDPASVATLATRALRWLLADLDAATIREAAAEKGWHHVLHAKGTALTEFGFHLIDQGVSPASTERPDGPGIKWASASGAEWGVWANGAGSNYSLTYEGPMSGLYGALPVLLPALHGHVPTDAGSPFTRHLTDRFPQLRPVDADEVEFGGYQDLHGWIALPSRAELSDPVTDSTRVCAQVAPAGVDFLLAAAAHLV
ncbi:hypothetical protein SAMN05216483_6681 [Streptomyces sp. 2131.1]|uniref:hypothetical protein n=1 Tax=Streptomyces sp. 2131.1 TaxID=1855346 RepID=UPI00089CAB22|nr:hypothetical protein [Streptomyces sp. 2131.1]SEE82793.1 hypothetical protein SAMN05216483_6681 [Streptomyces sp. 2131.1]